MNDRVTSKLVSVVDLDELIVIYQRHFGISLSRAEAEVLGERLISLVRAIGKPIK